jgi:hypothetical protein
MGVGGERESALPLPGFLKKKTKLKTVEIYQILISKIKIIFKNIYSYILNTKVIHKNVLKLLKCKFVSKFPFSSPMKICALACECQTHNANLRNLLELPVWIGKRFLKKYTNYSNFLNIAIFVILLLTS